MGIIIGCNDAQKNCCCCSKDKSTITVPQEYSISSPNIGTDTKKPKGKNERKHPKIHTTCTVINFRGLKHIGDFSDRKTDITGKSTVNFQQKLQIKRNKSSIALKPSGENRFILLDGKKTLVHQNTFDFEKIAQKDAKKKITKRLSTFSQATTSHKKKNTPPLHQDKKLSVIKQEEDINKTTLTSKNYLGPHENQIEYASIISSMANSSINIGVKKENGKKKEYEVINEPFDEKKLSFIHEVLQEEELLLEEMDDSVINMIINSMKFVRIGPDYTFYTSDKNKHDNNLYIIYKGKIEMKIDADNYELKKKGTISTQALVKNTKNFSLLKTMRKRVYLFILPLDVYFNTITEFMNKVQEEKLNHLKKIQFFQSAFDKQSLNKISQIIVSQKYKERTLIIEEGQSYPNLYIIAEGSALVSKEGEVIKKLSSLNIFGDIPLYFNTVSCYSYAVEPETEIYVMPYAVLDSIFGENPIEKMIHNIFLNSIKTSEILSKYFSVNNISDLFNCFQLKFYFNNVVISPKCKKFFIPIAGYIYQTNHLIKNLSAISFKNKEIFQNPIGTKGEMFGESYLSEVLNSIKYSIVSDECVIFEASWTDVLKITKSYSDRNVSLHEKITLLRKYSLFKGLSEINLFYLAEALKSKNFRKGELIIQNGPISDKYYIIRRGKVRIVINDIEVKVIEEPKSFGDIITAEKDRYLKEASFYAASPLETYYLEKEAYEDIIDCSILKTYNNLLNFKDITITLDQLYYIKDLGQGSYGKVYLITDTKQLYAMKTAEINVMIQNKRLAQRYLDEKSIMSSIEHPFIVQLINTFKTRDYIFFLIEYINNSTLRSYIEYKQTQLTKTRNITEITFLAAILCSVLSYLQKRRILHRDLKPDNIMVDKTGYLKVIDFGIAKNLAGKDYTHTLIGTLHYMAPEVVSGKSYAFSVDIWSVGIILYEIFYGRVPFGCGTRDSRSVYDEICNKKLTLACDPNAENFNLFVKDILHKDPNERVSSFRKWRNFDLFKGFEFSKLLQKEIKSPLLEYRSKKTDFDEKELITNSNCPFSQFMKNNMSSSSNELEELCRKNSKADAYLMDF